MKDSKAGTEDWDKPKSTKDFCKPEEFKAPVPKVNVPWDQECSSNKSKKTNSKKK